MHLRGSCSCCLLPLLPILLMPGGVASEILLSVSRGDAEAQRGSDLPEAPQTVSVPLSVALVSWPLGQYSSDPSKRELCAPLCPTVCWGRDL